MGIQQLFCEQSELLKANLLILTIKLPNYVYAQYKNDYIIQNNLIADLVGKSKSATIQQAKL